MRIGFLNLEGPLDYVSQPPSIINFYTNSKEVETCSRSESEFGISPQTRTHPLDSWVSAFSVSRMCLAFYCLSFSQKFGPRRSLKKETVLAELPRCPEVTVPSRRDADVLRAVLWSGGGE